VTNFLLGTTAQPQGGIAQYSFFIMMALIFVVFYFLIIRPQKKRQQQHQSMLGQLKKGDRVITSSGMYGTIFAIQDDQNKVVLKISDDIKVEFVKSQIAGKVES
jgi:preprotein translocase subunit YajC